MLKHFEIASAEITLSCYRAYIQGILNNNIIVTLHVILFLFLLFLLFNFGNLPYVICETEVYEVVLK